MGDQLKNLCCSHTMEYYIAREKNRILMGKFQNILSEKSKTPNSMVKVKSDVSYVLVAA
jgi:hypothetical protein